MRINIDKPSIPETAGFTHESTSWQVSLTKDFENELFAESLNDTENLYEYRVMQEIEPDTILFARVKINFSNGDDNGWSNIITISSNQKGFTLNNTIVVTPKLNIISSLLDVSIDDIEIESSEYLLFTGIGKHKATTWEVKTIHGKRIWYRENDDVNLTSIVIPKGRLDNNRTYIICAIYHTDTNVKSNRGQLVITTGGNV